MNNLKNIKNIIIIGGGAAGLMAAAAAGKTLNAGRAAGSARITVLEKNEKAGKKIYITGKGRCNFTNACDEQEFLRNVISHSKFLYSAIYGFNSAAAIDFFETNGMKTKVERGRRAFPESDHASDVTRALVKACEKEGVDIRLKTEAEELLTKDMTVTGVRLKDGTVINADAVIIATGGLSYSTTGSTGDGYRFADGTGHRVTDTHPSLVPLVAAESFCGEAAGLTLKNISVRFTSGKKKIYEDFGDLLFTHTGVSGPVVLSASAHLQKYIGREPVILHIDFKPAIDENTLDKRLVKEFTENSNKEIGNMFHSFLPKSLIKPVLEQARVSNEKHCRDITSVERREIVRVLKGTVLNITGMGGFNEAVITRGGVDTRDINPSTMESKIVRGLFFAGEVMDVDALTGGYNLQIAWATGHLAGVSAAESVI